MSELIERIARLPPEMRALLVKRLEERNTADTIAFERSATEKPLSFAQQRLWFIEQVTPNSPLYNNGRAFRLIGQLRFDLLVAALNEIVRRHDVLRTRFVAREGEARQEVLDRLELAPSLIDLGALPEIEREEEARRRIGMESAQPFDLSQGPLLRLLALDMGRAQTGEREHIVVFTLHHIV
ncbi:condensation domain-containing protein, partial [Methylosinus sp. Sm6]|uniref:condensation domain-containing protein n=1 Tax=Methylosinus sp. Sm6 TaxID=2866948 RepID=UPI001C996EC2